MVQRESELEEAKREREQLSQEMIKANEDKAELMQNLELEKEKNVEKEKVSFLMS